jgi:hypothetical protein
MNPTAQREMMVRQAAAMVVVMLTFFVTRLRRIRAQLEHVPYGPRSLGQQHRLGTLQMIFNSTDAECLAMLPPELLFLLYATFLEVEALFQKPMGVLLRSRL